eukprot:gene56833-biopygen45780
MDEAAAKGWPLVRAVELHYPADAAARGVRDQFLLGADLLVAPVLAAGAAARDVYLPPALGVPNAASHKGSGPTFGTGMRRRCAARCECGGTRRWGGPRRCTASAGMVIVDGGCGIQPET